MAKTHSDIGLIGLAVMGQNLALNIADHGFQISVFNRTVEKTEKFVAENPSTPGGLIGAKTLPEFVQSLAKPRKMIILVQAGKATDAVIDSLIPLLEANDIIIGDGAIIPLIARSTITSGYNSKLQGINGSPWDSEMWNIAEWTMAP